VLRRREITQRLMRALGVVEGDSRREIAGLDAVGARGFSNRCLSAQDLDHQPGVFPSSA
jgi:hypothetical protein